MAMDRSGSRLVTADEMKRLDENTITEHGMSSAVLMERAALAVVETLREEDFDLSRVLAVCGPGNNGGDGIAAARLLHIDGCDATVVFVGDREKRSEETRLQWRIAESYGVEIVDLRAAVDSGLFAEATTVIDCIFGIGGGRAPAGDFLDAVRMINRSGASGAEVLAVDIPSGVSADTGEAVGEAITADATVTFAYKKVGHDRPPGNELSGDVIVKDIGIY
ncbi:MAG: NAD(P)H-hydrate epimerase [Clostridiales Family XIII bacterium]|jgi:NAD(P)H-hydrate epimerase|nr:NAD(P)H-hydrate epimerase [Clostridiales Family XIII bacterium]